MPDFLGQLCIPSCESVSNPQIHFPSFPIRALVKFLSYGFMSYEYVFELGRQLISKNYHLGKICIFYTFPS